MLIHLVDGSEPDVAQAVKDIDEELEAYGQELAERPQIIVVNKTDMDEVAGRRSEIESDLSSHKWPVRFISAAGRTGVRELMDEVAARLAQLPPPAIAAPEEQPRPREERPPRVQVTGSVYTVLDDRAVRLVAGTDLRAWSGRVQLKRQLDRMGITRELEAAGIKEGSIVRFGETELEW